MDAETRANFKAIRETVLAISEKIDKRDIVLFGEDGRGGLVADVNAAKQRSRILTWIVGGVVFPLLVSVILFMVSMA